VDQNVSNAESERFFEEFERKGEFTSSVAGIREKEFGTEVAFPNVLVDTIASSTPGFALLG
jgi:hypothetical protein